MKKEFNEYNKKYFRNIQFIYDFFEKNGMPNSLVALKMESQVDHIKYYDTFFLEDIEHFEYDEANKDENQMEEEEEEEEEKEKEKEENSKNSSDDFDFDIDPDFLKMTIHNMNNSLLCKAIDNYEEMLRNNAEQFQKHRKEEELETNTLCEKEKEKEKDKEKRFDMIQEENTETGNEIKNFINGFIEGDKNIHSKLQTKSLTQTLTFENEIENKTKYEIKNEDNSESEGEDEDEGKDKFQIIPQLKCCMLKTKKEETEDKSGDHFSEYNYFQNEKKYNEKMCLYKMERNNAQVSKDERHITKKEKEQKQQQWKEEEEKEGESYEWENYFSGEKEIYKKIPMEYIQYQENKDKYNTYSENANILTVKYIDLYKHFFVNSQNTEFEDILFFRKYFPILILTGTANNYVKLFLTIYTSSNDSYKNNCSDDKEESTKVGKERENVGCVFLFEMLESITMNSPVIYIDVNYDNNLCIVSTMSGELYLCKVDLEYLKELLEQIELIDNFEHLVEWIKKKKEKKKKNIFEVVQIYKDHTKYSLKCEFNNDYSFFASISNDKNLNIYERVYNEKEKSYLYEKIKTVGLPETPSCFAWVTKKNKREQQKQRTGKEWTETKIGDKDNSKKTKEEIVIGMLNNNHILFLNSKTYQIEKKIDLFSSDEKYNILNLAYNKKKHILAICTDTSQLFVYSLRSEKIIKIIYGCVLTSLSFPSIELNNNGDIIYVTSDDKVYGTFILIFDIKSGNIINKINNGFKIRCLQIFKYFLCSDNNEAALDEINRNKKGVLFLGSFDKKIHFYSS